MLIVIIRSVLLYFIIVLSLRLMGKKQLAQLQPSELVTTILISNIATLSLEDLSVPMIYGVIPILMVVSMDVIMSHVMLKSTNIRRMVTGTPQIIISDGKIDQQVMKRLRYTIDATAACSATASSPWRPSMAALAMAAAIRRMARIASSLPGMT